MKLYDLNEFLRLSAVLNYQLAAEEIGRENILNIILNYHRIPEQHRKILLEILAYLQAAYGVKKRRLGPAAVLHPIRAAAILARAADSPCLLDLLTVLLHDKLEDLTEKSMGELDFQRLDPICQASLDKLGPDDSALLADRLQSLTRPDNGETYNHYVGRMLTDSPHSLEVVRAKLADRLDNTLDMRIDIQDPLEGANFFQELFQSLFLKNYAGYHTYLDHPHRSPLNGVKRLYQLFKNTVLMSLIRQTKVGLDDKIASGLFKALASATMREAERIVLHVFAYHYPDLVRQRECILSAMEYCYAGHISEVTAPTLGHPLDGLFQKTFSLLDSADRDLNMAQLYADKPRMIQAGLAFVAICMGFLNDPDFYVHGVTADGIRPE